MLKEKKNEIILLILLAVSSVSLFYELNGDFLKGGDSYYYALQTEYRAGTGDIKVPDSSPVFRLTGFLQRAGFSTETSIKIFQSLLLFVTGVSLFLLLGRGAGTLSILFCLLFIFSPSFIFSVVEFPKMVSFVFLVPVFLYLSTLEDHKSLLAFVPALFAVFLHKSAIPAAGLFIAILIARYYIYLFFRVKNLLWITFAVVCILIICFVFLFDTLHFFDFSRFSWEEVSPGFLSLLKRKSLPFLIKAELVITFLLYLFIVFNHVTKGNAKKKVLFTVPLFLPGFFPFGAGDVFSAGEMLAIMLPVMFLISSLFLLGSQENNDKESFNWKSIYFSLLLIPVILLIRMDMAHPEWLDSHNKKYETVTKAVSKYEIPMLIAPRGINYYYKYRLKREAFLYEPEDHWNKKRIWRLVYKISADELLHHLKGKAWTGGYIKGTNTSEYYLIREDYWVRFRSLVNKDKNEDLYNRVWNSSLNPSKKRPSFLYRKYREKGYEIKDEGEFPALPAGKKS